METQLQADLSDLDFDLKSGIIRWKTQRSRNIKPGQIAGNISKVGYRSIKIDGKSYLAHRLVWLFAAGDWPKGDLDHINGDKLDNRISNLREANKSQNGANKHAIRSGLKGCCWNRGNNKWQASIRKNGKRTFLGYFDTEQEAHDAYCSAALIYHGEFARFN